MSQITGETLIGAIVREHPEACEVLFSIGMHCLGCPASQMESLAEAAMVHGYKPEDVVNAVNEAIAKKEQQAE